MKAKTNEVYRQNIHKREQGLCLMEVLQEMAIKYTHEQMAVEL